MNGVKGKALGRVLTWVSGLLAVACGGSSTVAPNAAPTPTPLPPPSIVLIVTDDLDAGITSLLPRLPVLFGQTGVTFSRTYVTQSLCAPSRASIFTGQYPHNHRLIYNEPPDGGFPSFRAQEASTVATWLHSAGYRTALLGKYLNGYPHGAPDNYIPPGWDEWFATLDDFENGRYFNYWMNDNGKIERYGSRPDQYSTDVLTRRAVEYVQKAGPGPDPPFFLYVATAAPHAPAIPAERHSGDFPREGMFRNPSFNEDDVRNKPAWVQAIPRMTDADIRRGDSFQRGRLRTMRAVEELIEQVLAALAATGRLETTYVFVTSDNGLLMGEHRAVGRKANHYEESIRVPLLVRGPRVPAGLTLAHPVLNIDFAPTFADLARIPIPESVDGRSLVPLLRPGAPGLEAWRTDFLVEHFSSGVTAAVRTTDYLYAELESNERELYDMHRDPYQIDSLHRKVDPAVMEPLSKRIAALLSCRGASCRN